MLLQTATLLGVLVLGFGYFWLLVPSLEARLQQLGLFCSTFTISMYLSPLADLVSGGCPGSGGHKTVTYTPKEGKTQTLEDRAVEVGEWEAGGKG